MAEIADTVGIRGPSLYYHFEIKPDILREIAKTGLNECLAIADQIISDPSLAPAARIYKLVYECILYLCSSEYEFTCLFDSALAEKEFDDIIELKKTWESVFQRFLQSAAESNQLQIEDVPLTTHTMRGLFAWSIRDQDGVGEIETKAIARHVADFALRSLLEDNRELEQIHAQIDASESFGTAV